MTALLILAAWFAASFITGTIYVGFMALARRHKGEPFPENEDHYGSDIQ